jgi:hypothetical protein
MEQISVTLNLNINDYPILNNINKDDFNDFIMKIFNTGYHIHFPKYQITEHNHMMLKINELHDSIKNLNIVDHITSLDTSLNKLIGLSSNSNKKGHFAENILETIFETRYGDIKFDRKSQTAHSGDAWLILPDNTIVILESKNYTTTVNKDEILKLQNDMIENYIKWGIMISFNSQIQGFRELDYHTFIHNNETYSIIMISNLANNISKLDLGLQIIRKLILQLNDKINFPWIVNDINSSLVELNDIVKKNYQLRDLYYSMERDIQKSLSSYHIKLRDYQYEIELKITEITNKITSTMNKSDIINVNSPDLLKLYQDKKISPLLSRLLDVINENKWEVEVKESNLWKVNYKDEIIAEIKIQLKKIIINIINNDLIITLNLGKDKENLLNLELIKLLNK